MALLLGVGCQTGAETAPKAEVSLAKKEPASVSTVDEVNPRLLRRFQPVGGDAAREQPNPDRVALGRMLFYEKRLSRDHQIACNSCHFLDKYGTDGKATSTGVDGKFGTRNAPTVFNAATHIAQFWDGRTASIEQQASGPLLNAAEMAMPGEEAVKAVIEAIPEYVVLFHKAFPGEANPISLKNLGEAIGAFERGLVTVSRWDKFIGGDTSALSAQEKHGLRVFLDVGCMACHTGTQVGGTMFKKVGAILPWPNQKDEGRSAITKASADRLVFKVPTLKNITKTAPYFHDGSVATLEEAIQLMGRHQLGLELNQDEVASIAAWMGSMTGDVDPVYIAMPVLPKGRALTPRSLAVGPSAVVR